MSELRAVFVAPDTIAPAWDELAERMAASPFVRPGWVLPWHETFGRGRLVVAAAYHEDQLKGVLPLQRRLGVVSSPTNWHTPEFGFLAEGEDVARTLLAAAFRAATIQLKLEFVDVATANFVRSLATDNGWVFLSRPVGEAAFVVPSGRFDDYLASLSRNTRKQLQRRRRDLEACGHVTLEVNEVFDEGAFDSFVAVEGSGWKNEQGTAISARPLEADFYRRVAQWASAAGWLRLALLRLDGHVVAGDLALECEGVHYVLKTGYSQAYERMSPGRVLREDMLRRAFGVPLARYELLGQDARWKRSWRPAYRTQLRVHAMSPAAAVVMRPVHNHGGPPVRAVRRWMTRSR